VTSIIGTTGDFLALDTENAQATTTVECLSSVYKLLVHTWNPSLNIDIPKTIVWNSPEVTQLSSVSKILKKVLTPPENNIISSGSFVLNSVPTALFIYAKRVRASDGTCYG